MDVQDVRRRASALVDKGAVAEAVATLESAAGALSASDPAAASALLVDAAAASLHPWGPDRSVAYARQAVELARIGGGAPLAIATVRLGDALSWAGRYEDARSAWTEATRAPGANEQLMLAERANALLRLGDPAARDAAFRALIAARASGSLDALLDALTLVTVAEVRAGRLKEALGTAEELLGAARAGSMDRVDAIGLLAWVLAILGDEQRCLAAIQDAEQGLEALRVTPSTGLARGLLALSTGASTEAAAAFESKLTEPRWGPVAVLTSLRPFAAELIEAYARAGEIEKGRRVLAATLPVALGSGQPRLIAPIRRSQGILEDDEDAFQAALDAHAGWTNAFEAARTRLALGELLRRRRRRAEAREQLQMAEAAFRQVGAARWRDRALAELRLAGERLPARRSVDLPGPEALTLQEGEVLELVRAGLANREIAERLVLSVKTVEGHLTTIYGKLGVTSRAQALAALGARRVSDRDG